MDQLKIENKNFDAKSYGIFHRRKAKVVAQFIAQGKVKKSKFSDGMAITNNT
jgi:hypothetical protein